jgi:glycosyltransferase involved in cell wall biosynthesis
MYTIGESLFAAIRQAEPGSAHEFIYYVAAAQRDPPPGVVAIPYTRRALYGRGAVYQAREMLDRARVPTRGLRTWLERSVAEHDVDLVWFATNYAEECNRPFIFTMFDVEHARQPWFPEVSADGEWERRQRYYARYIPKATRVIVPNEAGREQLVHHFRLNPERALCLGHPTPGFALEASSREKLPRERVERLGLRDPYLFYPAQFWAHKNHATLLTAMAELGDRYQLALTGSDKGQLDHVRGLAQELRVGDRVHFLGFVEEDDLVALYQHAHALTYMSYFGPENLPPLEALALGCPVIAADVPGAELQLGDAALLVPPGEAARLAEAVRQLEDPGLRDEQIRTGRTRATSRTAAVYVRGVLDFLDEFERVRRCWA